MRLLHCFSPLSEDLHIQTPSGETPNLRKIRTKLDICHIRFDNDFRMTPIIPQAFDSVHVKEKETVLNQACMNSFHQGVPIIGFPEMVDGVEIHCYDIILKKICVKYVAVDDVAVDEFDINATLFSESICPGNLSFRFIDTAICVLQPQFSVYGSQTNDEITGTARKIKETAMVTIQCLVKNWQIQVQQNASNIPTHHLLIDR